MGTWVYGLERVKRSIGALLVLVVASCSGEPAPRTSSDAPLVLRTIDEDRIIPDIGNTGTLVIVGSCVALDDEIDGPLTVVWPNGLTSWSAETQTVRIDFLYDREPFVASIGDEVVLSGGRSTSGVEWVTRPADDCPTAFLVTGG